MADCTTSIVTAAAGTVPGVVQLPKAQSCPAMPLGRAPLLPLLTKSAFADFILVTEAKSLLDGKLNKTEHF